MYYLVVNLNNYEFVNLLYNLRNERRHLNKIWHENE